MENSNYNKNTNSEYSQGQMPNKNRKKNNNTLIIAVAILAAAAIIVCCVVCVFTANTINRDRNESEKTQIVESKKIQDTETDDANKEEEELLTPAPTEVQTQAPAVVQTPIPKSDSGWTVETATLTGRAAEDENKDFTRKNIHLTNVKEYVEETIRPLYYEITDKFDNLQKIGGDMGRTWYIGDESFAKGIQTPIACVKYDAGAEGNKYERRYYFDTLNDELIFAFIFLGKEEYRLYFYKDSIIRYIDNYGNIYDNPEEQYILDKAQNAISEAYVYWD